MRQTRTILREKVRESLRSVLPITGIVFALCFFVVPVPSGILLSFVLGAVMLIVGMGLFTLGTDLAMTPMGEHVGRGITKSRKLWLIILVCFLVGTIITISEPDLQVLAGQVKSIPNTVLILAVAIGVGFFLVVAMLRILFHIKLSYLLVGCYILVFALAFFVPKEFLSVAFDAGGVTTGPMTVPFIMALGVGIAGIRSDEEAENDSFGLVAFCSVGPILMVMLLGILYHPGSVAYEAEVLTEAKHSKELWGMFLHSAPQYLKDVMLSLLPIVIFFGLFQISRYRAQGRELLRIAVGVIYTYLGLSLYLTGVNVGFMPMGNYIGAQIGALSFRWILIPLGMLVGYFIVAAEPAVHVLNKQVEEMTSGAIPKKVMEISLSTSVSLSVGLAMVRVLFDVPILYFLIPGYLLALILTFISPPIFTAIAFDSGGVASGPMTATFLLPFAMGACAATGGNVILNAFGIVAMVAMTPVITIQVLGSYYRVKSLRHREVQPAVICVPEVPAAEDEEIINL